MFAAKAFVVSCPQQLLLVDRQRCRKILSDKFWGVNDGAECTSAALL
jgi:hypothetical protein